MFALNALVCTHTHTRAGFRSSGGGGPGGGSGGFHFRDPADIFAQFFGSSNPFAAFGGEDGPGGGGMPGGFTFISGGMPGMMGGGGGMPPGMMGGMGMPPGMGGGGGRRGPQKAEPIKRSLLLTLEELFAGTIKRIKITRQRLDPGGGNAARSEEKILEVAVKPGWKKGTTITFENEGDEAPGVVPADIQFVVAEKDHERFKRDGSNLICDMKLPLADAICGTTLRIPTLDGRVLAVPVTEIISPGYEKVVRGEGMPNPKAGASARGDLILRFSVSFPSYLSDDKKTQLRRLLA